MWLATSGGAYEYNGTTWINHKWDYYYPYVWDITVDKKGNVLVGAAEGLKYYDGTGWTEWEIETGKTDQQVRTVAFDPDGSLWCGTIGGIVHYDGTTFTRYTTHDGLVNDDVFTLDFDQHGNLWIGTGGGVSLYDGKIFRTITTTGVTTLSFSPDGSVWMGSPRGLYCYDGDTLKTYSIYDNSVHNFISEIAVTNEGVVWIGTQNGVSRFVPDNISSDVETTPVRPSGIKITGNYPNPFNPYTTITYSLTESSQVTLSIYNPAGQLVENLINELKPAGSHAVTWKPENLSSGVYLYRLKKKGYHSSGKMMLIK